MNSVQANAKNQVNPKQKSNTFHLSVMQNLPGLTKSIGHFLTRRDIFILYFLVCSPGISYGDPYLETLNQINTLSDTYINNYTNVIAQHKPGTFEYSLSEANPKQKLTPCSSEIQVKPLPGSFESGRFLLKVFCLTPTPWSVSLPGEINHFIEVVVTARPLSRGEIITVHDIAWKKFSAKQVRPGYTTNAEALIGFEVKRSLQANQPIKPNYVTPPILVKKGEYVSITAQLNSLKVKSAGVALSNGAMGQVILVKNRKTKRIIEATIFAPGQVKISL